MTSVLTPTHGINVVLDQRQLSSGVSLVLSVFKVWVPSQCNQCDGSKKQSQHQPLPEEIDLPAYEDWQDRENQRNPKGLMARLRRWFSSQ